MNDSLADSMAAPLADTRLVIFGEVLFDCFPDGSRVLGGAPFNVAWHCQAFGLQPLLISRLGDDALGQQIGAAMQHWSMDTTGIQTDPQHPTGKVDVSFNHGEPEYDIVENSAWDFIDQQTLPVLDQPCVLYHGSLALRSPISDSAFQQVKKHAAGALFVDINLRAPWWQSSVAQKLIGQSRWLKINKDELNLLVPQENDTASKLQYLLTATEIQRVVVTLGEKGAMAATKHETVSVAPKKITQLIDTVGAGDAFSSVLLLGLFKGWGLQQTLQRAQQFASAVVEQRGATTTDSDFYQPFISAWEL
ncbi:MAG: carbohydrate kinase [Gammaproteobacteria bacterium]|nr:carbohydrate kinase [Gammaproteobacteria bacterium]